MNEACVGVEIIHWNVPSLKFIHTCMNVRVNRLNKAPHSEYHDNVMYFYYIYLKRFSDQSTFYIHIYEEKKLIESIKFDI